jgi:hypothetical protein
VGEGWEKGNRIGKRLRWDLDKSCLRSAARVEEETIGRSKSGRGKSPASFGERFAARLKILVKTFRFVGSFTKSIPQGLKAVLIMPGLCQG